MKTFIYRISLVTLVALFTACSEKNNNPEPEQKLTNCTNCQFLFTLQADLAIPNYNLTIGNYRVFWSEIKKSVVTQKMYIKAPMQGDSFTLSKSDIVAGKVIVLDNCPQCNLIGMYPVDGTVTGTNTTTGARADRVRWLIEAKIIREPLDRTFGFRDTVYVKQYFDPNFILD